MNAQSLLNYWANHYDFQRANRYLANPELRFFAKPWLVVELSHALKQGDPSLKLEFAPRYQANKQPLRYREKTAHIEPCDKRFASYADFSITHGQQHLWIEVFSIHQTHFHLKKERNKMHANLRRVVAFRNAVPEDQVLLLSILWGTFESRDAVLLAEFDHDQCCTYALDTAAKGSSQISRLCQIRKSGQPRLILAVS